MNVGELVEKLLKMDQSKEVCIDSREGDCSVFDNLKDVVYDNESYGNIVVITFDFGF